uniref:Uncharacterized protein n=1 Tax=Magnetococcus massalia (strain MO-1) TaxID=451514 RepID=A0A1S7LM52_MAGMO|nr:protein of unknown function [Candidatus Magnetococcus massalia]
MTFCNMFFPFTLFHFYKSTQI